MPNAYTLNVNGSDRTVSVDPDRSLLSVLRDELDLTGSKYGCGEGECGACMVLLDGEATPSCQTKVGEAEEKRIITIEGLASGGRLHPLQQAFLDNSAMQCGYCTPGMIVRGVGLLMKNPDPSEEEILQHMEKNICRCGTYPRIVRAVQQAAAALKSAGGVR